MISQVYNMDCMELMAQYPDKYFDLAVVDPPYGIGAASDKRGNTQYGKAAAVSKSYGKKEWDKEPPNNEYFNQLLRISKNQIIWGANHFLKWNSSCWLVWDKDNGDNGYADCELAWTSFDSAVRKFKWKWQGMLQQNMKNKEHRIHPTQKPVALYDWIYKNYAKEGDKILDTHLGSGFSRIAANKAGLDFIGCELDKDYFEAQEKRYKDFVSQLRMF
jgi:site-specific DNA-methyltransferase (adenine-specific)